jgi:type IV secretion system protein VirD4
MLSLDHASIVVTDPSGELYQKTSGALKAKGYRIQVLNFDDPLSSIRFNPLANLKDQIEIEEIAHVLVKSASP